MNKNPSTLVATMGGQPQVVTFVLDELLRMGEVVNRVYILHPLVGDSRMRNAHLHIMQEFTSRMYRGHPCAMTMVPLRHGTVGVEQIDRQEFANAAWHAAQSLLRQLKSERSPLHLCVTGGPRMLGMLALSVASLCFDHGDQIWHLFTERALRTQADGGAIMHVDPTDDVRLLRVPAPMLGLLFPPMRDLFVGDPQRLIQSMQADPDAPRRSAVLAQLTPRQLEVLTLFAQGRTPPEVQSSLNLSAQGVSSHLTVVFKVCREIWSLPEDYRLTYHWIREKFGDWIDETSVG